MPRCVPNIVDIIHELYRIPMFFDDLFDLLGFVSLGVSSERVSQRSHPFPGCLISVFQKFGEFYLVGLVELLFLES